MQFTEKELSDFYQWRIVVGRNIHNMRIRRKMPMHKFAAKTTIHPQKLDLYETGRGNIGLLQIVQIAQVLKVEVQRLFIK